MIKFWKKIKFVHIFWFLFYLFIFGLLLKNSLTYLDPDFGWHLKVGQEIAQTAAVPHINHYDYAFSGRWVDHEWLSNLLIYKLYAGAGYLAVNIALALIILAAFISLTIFIYRRWSGRPPAVWLAVFQFLGIFAALPHFGVRIQEISVLFLLILLIIIYAYSRQRKLYYLCLLPPLFYLWANLHAGFLIGLFVIFAWAGVKIIERWWARRPEAAWLDRSGLLSPKEILFWLGAALLSAGATLLTPYHLELYSFLGGYRSSYYLSHISEWLSQLAWPFHYWQLLYLSLILAALAFYLYYARRRKYFSVDLWTVGLVLLFTALSFQSRRNFPLLFISSLPFLLVVFPALFNAAEIGRRLAFRWWLKACLAACLVLAIAAQFANLNLFKDPFVFFSLNYPYDAVNFLKAHPAYDQYNLLNDYSWGGYLIWQYPSRSLFIDGRLPQVPMNGHSYLEEYAEFYRTDDKISAQLAKYDIRLVLMPAKDRTPKVGWLEKILFSVSAAELKNDNNLRRYLSASPGWRTLYGDGAAIIYLKGK